MVSRKMPNWVTLDGHAHGVLIVRIVVLQGKPSSDFNSDSLNRSLAA